ncbi:related to TIR2 Cold shock induced protein [Rhynchosporium graminicola]|uniref:Related to TIR2 Cold shock induced protein n=1 Tax=Rhynchosporium graminicola TaxID=2792576 RepID=A0A1E1LR86_9HELO|nr:related to TIR2 Cold shock induced protein [Rhynchosporium commune]
MRTSFSTLAVMVTSLLVKEAFGAPALRRDYYLDTDSVVVTEEIWVNQLPDGSYSTGLPTAVVTSTIDGNPVLVTEPVPSPTNPPPAPIFDAPAIAEVAVPDSTTSTSPIPEPTLPSVPDAVFIEQKPPSTSVEPTTYPTPTTSVTPTVVPTTLESVAIPTPSVPAAPVAPIVPPISSSGKRGLAYNAANLLSAFTSASNVTWAYNWGSSTVAIPSNLEYVPMLWGLRQSETSNWHESADKALAAGSTHLLAFNEPDLGAQANLGYAEAAAGYLTYMQPYASKAKLVSPAVTNGGGEMGLTWLSNFLRACSSCTIDKVALHWYNGGDAAAFKEYMAKAYTAGGNRPLWITEFEASGSDEEQAAFLTEVMAWMDKTDYIERYAYFMVSDGNLVDGTTLSKLGSAYASS